MQKIVVLGDGPDEPEGFPIVYRGAPAVILSQPYPFRPTEGRAWAASKRHLRIKDVPDALCARLKETQARQRKTKR